MHSSKLKTKLAVTGLFNEYNFQIKTRWLVNNADYQTASYKHYAYSIQN